MVKPNYAFAKRQKQIAKKKKKDEKRMQKLAVDDSQPELIQPVAGDEDKATKD
jgi:hypothetical protein